jgi:hypothetical protein
MPPGEEIRREELVPIRRLIVLSLIVSMPAAAAAQFTTFIPPQTKVADSAKAAVAAQKTAQADTSINTRLTNLKTWVDSAAGVAAPSTQAQDSLGTANPDSAAVRSSATNASDTAALRNGARAPETASDLPLLALVGAVTLGLGALLLGAGGNRRMRTDA